MLRSRSAARWFALAGMLLAFAGVLDNALQPGRDNRWSTLMYFTNWTNLLAGVVFGLHLLRLRRPAPDGSQPADARLARVTMYVTASGVLVTVAYWALLAPIATTSLWTFRNLATHLVTPLLLAVFYFARVRPGAQRGRDVGLALVLPLAYLGAVYLGYAGGFVYSVDDYGVEERFPYFFLDHVELGVPMALVYMAGIAVGVAAVAWGLVAIDRRRASRDGSQVGASA
ncbi:MAG: Pr6Pr family membrane protein [Promicromonosporaceae bacterium]|nr:Pr6Pr family membrane protein [Promicromonosporaceae bacterium]